MCKCSECVSHKHADAVEQSYAEFIGMVHEGKTGMADVLDYDEKAAERVIWLVLTGKAQEAKELAENMLIGAANRYAHSVNEKEAA